MRLAGYQEMLCPDLAKPTVVMGLDARSFQTDLDGFSNVHACLRMNALSCRARRDKYPRRVPLAEGCHGPLSRLLLAARRVNLKLKRANRQEIQLGPYAGEGLS